MADETKKPGRRDDAVEAHKKPDPIVALTRIVRHLATQAVQSSTATHGGSSGENVTNIEALVPLLEDLPEEKAEAPKPEDPAGLTRRSGRKPTKS